VFWAELEDNATFYHGDPNDGKMQLGEYLDFSVS
jgi:hypothetical protein